MLSELLMETKQHKEDILGIMDKTLAETKPAEIIYKWTAANPKERKKPPIITVDGSVNNINYVSKVLYSTSSHAIYYNGEGIDRLAAINKTEVLPNMAGIQNVFSKQMALMELKTILHAIHTTPAAKYVLVDGDLYSMIDHINRNVPYLSRKDPFIKEYTTKVVEEEENNFEAAIPSISSILSDVAGYPADPVQTTLYFQMIRELCVLKNLLSNYSDKIVSISKTSRTKSLYNHTYLSDMALINMYCDNAGFSQEVFKDDLEFNSHLERKTIQNYPVYHDFFRDLTFTNRFVRLTDKGSVIKIQLPGHPNAYEFMKIFETLLSHATLDTGYPFLLKRVHDEVKISSKDMKTISRILGLNYDHKERHML